MTSFVYTDYKTFEGSSVLSQAFYNRNDLNLLVSLHNGTYAGYENVPENLWKNFIREAQFPTGSVGRFWNTMIKPNYTGFTTTDIDDFSSLEDEEYERVNYGLTDSDFFNPTAVVTHVEISEAAPDEAPELDAPSEPRPEDFAEGTPSRAAYEFLAKESPEIVNLRAGADIGQRRYEIIVERTVVREEVKVIYANSEDEALSLYNDTFGALPPEEFARIVGITRRF